MPPDILLVFPDQWRGDCLGHLGHPTACTPYLDQLAAEGTSFTQARSPSPVCIPARACLATGLSPWRCGRLGYQDGQPWPYRHTLMHRLRGAGYQTVCVGKTHFHPMRLHLGFDELRAYEASIREPGYESDYHRWLHHETGGRVTDPALHRHPNALPVEVWEHAERLHNTHWTMEQSLDVLATRDPTRPLFMQIGFHRPHVPFDPPRRHVELLRDRELPGVPVGDWVEDREEQTAASAQRGPWRPADLDAMRRAYHAQLAFIDEQVGRLLWWLRRHGRERETWIVFSSDHGELLGDHHRMFKSSFLEGSARVPLVVRPPPGSPCPRGQRRDELVDLIDILPTCCGLADLAVDPEVDGRDLGPLVRGESPGWRERWHGECHGGAGRECLTDGRYTYLWDARDGHELLFDLSDDPTECRDLAARSDHAALLARWRAHLVEELDGRGCGLVADGALVSGAALAPTRRELLDAAGDPSGPFVG